jgi:hypothetical protein
MAAACKSGPGATCQAAVVQAIDNARAAEGVKALVVPSFYGGLTEAEQLLVLADLERVDRGLPGFGGLSTSLDSMAQAGAASNSDPNGPANSNWGSNWAGGEASALLADYDWMYDDGPGSPNLDCTSADPGGCWAHRENILGDYGSAPSMGAGVARVNGVTSLTEIFSSGPAGALSYRLPSMASSGPSAPPAFAPKHSSVAPKRSTVAPKRSTVEPKTNTVVPKRSTVQPKAGLSEPRAVPVLPKRYPAEAGTAARAETLAPARQHSFSTRAVDALAALAVLVRSLV